MRVNILDTLENRCSLFSSNTEAKIAEAALAKITAERTASEHELAELRETYKTEINAFKQRKEADHFARRLNPIAPEAIEAAIATESAEIAEKRSEITEMRDSRRLKELKFQTLAAIVHELREELATDL